MQCPRCNYNNEQLAEQCSACGWEFSHFLGDISPEDLNREKVKLEIAQNVWTAHQKGSPDFDEYLETLDDDSKDAAIDWLENDAERGIAAAQNLLGEAYCYGYGVDEDEEEAQAWLRKSAALNYPRAFYNLGEIYRNGYGVDIDEDEALRWHEKGAKLGDSDCKTAIKEIVEERKNSEQERLKRISESGDVQRFVAGNDGNWSHQQWVSFRSTVVSKFGVVTDAALGDLLEAEKRRYLAAKKAAEEKAEQERIARINAEHARIAKENAEKERIAKENARLEKERLEKERVAQAAHEQQENIYKEAQLAAQRQLEREKNERSERERKLATENAEKEKISLDKAVRKQQEKEKLARVQTEDEPSGIFDLLCRYTLLVTPIIPVCIFYDSYYFIPMLGSVFCSLLVVSYASMLIGMTYTNKYKKKAIISLCFLIFYVVFVVLDKPNMHGVNNKYIRSLQFNFNYYAAKIGSPIAMRHVALAYSSGNGAPINRDEAIKLFQKAADKGEHYSISYLKGYQEGKIKYYDSARDHVGKVIEIVNSSGYTYLLIEEKEQKLWIAMPITKINYGEVIRFPDSPPLINFISKPLNKTFEKIIFVNNFRPAQ